MRYLSDQWIDAADASVRSIEPSAEPFAVSYIVTDGPDGDRSYTLDLGTPSIRPGADAAVGLRMRWDVATAIATGDRSAQRAFLDGDIQITGDTQALLGAGDTMAVAEAALSSLRARTAYH